MLVKHFILNNNCVAYDHNVQQKKKEDIVDLQRLSEFSIGIKLPLTKELYMLQLCIAAYRPIT